MIWQYKRKRGKNSARPDWVDVAGEEENELMMASVRLEED